MANHEHELTLLLADGSVVSLALVEAVGRVRAAGHTIAINPDGSPSVSPSLDPMSEEAFTLDGDWAGVAALLSVGA